MQEYNVSIPNVLSEATIVGRMVKDVDFRATDSQNVSNLRLAVSRRYLQSEEWKEQTAFVNFAVWGDGAERLRNYKKGDIVVASFSFADLIARPFTSGSENMASLDVKRAQVSRFAWAANGNGSTASAPVHEGLQGIEF